MLKIKWIFLSMFFLGTISLIGQSEQAFFNAIKAVDMTTVESYLEDKIEFCIYEDPQFMTKQAAITKLKSFLTTNKPTSIEIMHKGNSKDRSSQYKVAKLTTTQGVLRIFVYSTGSVSQKTIKEIRIDKF